MRAEVKVLALDAALDSEEELIALEEELIKLEKELIELENELLELNEAFALESELPRLADELLGAKEEMLVLEEELLGSGSGCPPQATSAVRGIAKPPVFRARSNPDMYLFTNIYLLSYKN